LDKLSGTNNGRINLQVRNKKVSYLFLVLLLIFATKTRVTLFLRFLRDTLKNKVRIVEVKRNENKMCVWLEYKSIDLNTIINIKIIKCNVKQKRIKE
jgi:hypothetical protein